MNMLRIGDGYVMLDSIVGLLRYRSDDGEDWRESSSGERMRCIGCLSSGHSFETASTCEEVLALMDEELKQVEAPNMLTALEEIASLGGQTLLGPDSKHKMGDNAPRYHEMGAAAAFEQTALIARNAIEAT